jgi:hypothetical protein
MSTSTPKRYLMPFFNPKNSSAEVEAAAIFAFAESGRSKGGGLISRQPEEKLISLSKMGYPLWLAPKNELVFIFDGLSDTSRSVPYFEVPSVEGFIKSLEENSSPKENYYAFLEDHTNYFQKFTKEKQFIFRSLVVDIELKKEFTIFRREATEISGQVNVGLLPPVLDESAILSMLSYFEKLQTAQRGETLKLPECIRLVYKTTGQYITELDYEAQAATEEMDAKIRALDEFVKPKVAQLNKAYKAKKQKITDDYDLELDRLQRQMIKAQKSIQNIEGKIKTFEREAKNHAEKNHKIYEKRWKEKSKQSQKEVKELKKDLKTVDAIFKKTIKQKSQEINQLNFQLDSEVKLMRQPLLDLQTAREDKIRIFKLESEKLLKLEKPVIEDLNKTLKLQEAFKASFEEFGFKDQSLKGAALFYVPFFLVCYQAAFTRRYVAAVPSTINTIDFSTKLKGAFGLSKTKDLLVPRFKAIAGLVSNIEEQSKHNLILESRLYDLAQRNNYLTMVSFRDNVSRGLVYLNHEGWLSDREQKILSSRLSI